VLAELGFRRLIPEPRRGFDERFGKGASFENDQALQVDLHRTLALGPFGLWIDPEALQNATTEFRADDLSLRRLDDTHALIHACIHAALGRQQPLLVPLRDVAQIAWSGSVDWGAMSERTREWRLAAPVAHAMRTTADTLDAWLPEETEQLLSIRIPWLEGRSLEAYTTDRARRGGAALAALWAIPGIKARAAYIRALLFPEGRFREARQQGSGGRRSRLMIPLRWAVDRIRGRHG
jgi:putative nucleotidyltransferase-like protein